MHRHSMAAAVTAFAALTFTLVPSAQALVVAIDDFSVVKNGASFFVDPFNDGNEPPSAPNFANGNPATYGVRGSFAINAESSGRLTIDTALGATSANALTEFRREVGATLLSNVDPSDLAVGLKSDDTLTLQVLFGLRIPTGPLFNAYGIQFVDAPPGQTSHQLVQLFVQFNQALGIPQIAYIEQDFDADTITGLGAVPLVPPPGADEIALRIERPNASSNNFFASFAFVSGGITGPFVPFATPGQMFEGENFVRARFFASDTVAVSEPNTLWLVFGAILLSLLGLHRTALRVWCNSAIS
jgi:hypothetical protein